MLFKKVKCKAYLAKSNDGKFISSIEHNGKIISCCYVDMNIIDENGNPIETEIEDCCGDLEFLKTYYERKEKVFEGFMVGTKKIVTKGYLYADTKQDEYYPDVTYIGKQPKEAVDCAVVYFANNRKRYVLLEDIEVCGSEKARKYFEEE